MTKAIKVVVVEEVAVVVVVETIGLSQGAIMIEAVTAGTFMIGGIEEAVGMRGIEIVDQMTEVHMRIGVDYAHPHLIWLTLFPLMKENEK